MAVIKCRDCGNRVSTAAVSCPNCGRIGTGLKFYLFTILFALGSIPGAVLAK
jgi:hypothetical protein